MNLLLNLIGYPYFLQEWGFHVWNATLKSPIRGADVERVTPEIIAHLDANFFRVRSDRLTTLQQKYLRAMQSSGQGLTKPGTSPPLWVSKRPAYQPCDSN